MPSQSRTLQSLRELFHPTKSPQITEASRRCGILGKKIDECPLKSQGFGDSFPLHLSRHQRSRSHADGASLPGEANVLNGAMRRPAHEYNYFVATGRIVAFSLGSRRRQFAKISRPF